MGYRLGIASKYILEGYPTTEVLMYSGIKSSTWYKHKNKEVLIDKRKNNPGRALTWFNYTDKGQKVSNTEIVKLLKKYKMESALSNSGGYRKLKYYLNLREGIIINHKKVYRLCKENNLLLPKRVKCKKPRVLCTNKTISRPNELWEFDIKYGYIHGENRYFFILAYIDIYSRKIMYAYVGLQCKASNLINTLSLAIKNSQISTDTNLIIRSDNGPQMTSNQFKSYLSNLEYKILHEFIPNATPNKNAHIESFYSIVEREFIQVHFFNSMTEVYQKFNDFIDFYNNKRVHSSLKYKTPQQIIDLYNKGIRINIKKLKV